METLSTTVIETTYRNADNGYTVLRAGEKRSEITIVGILPPLSPGESVTFTGMWTEHPTYGRQFSAQSCEITQPVGKSAIEKYLGSGLIKGIGHATAKQLIEKFGDKTLEVIEEHPERLLEISGIGKKRAAMIIESYQEQATMRRTLVFLQKYGISPNLSMKIAKYYGEDTILILKENPYRMVMDIEGVGFLTADRIAISMGISPTSEFRIRAALFYLMQVAAGNQGHTYVPREELLNQAEEMIHADREIINREITNAMLLKDLQGYCFEDCEEAVCLPVYFYAELEIARRIKRLIAFQPEKGVMDIPRKISDYEKKLGVTFGARQKDAIRGAVEQGVFVITGGPGTGKTTIIRCIISLLQGQTVLLCAPTGRAAKRMTEATGQEAKTIHRLLEYTGEIGDFARDEDNPLEADCVIVDEVSMVDVRLMRSLLRAIAPGTRLILVGDSDQLPSVGAGNVLHDILESGAVNSVCLKEIFRQDESSMIVLNAHKINEGEMPELRTSNTDFFFIRKVMQSEAAQTIAGLVSQRLPGYLKLPKESWQREASKYIQVLTPTKKGDCGSYALNRLLQATLNPPRAGESAFVHGDTQFHLRDKVIQTKNDYQIEYKRRLPDGGIEKGEGVFNGDVGYITAMDTEESTLTVCFDEDRYVVYQKQQLDSLELAYCLTVHKSQGSEFPVVVMPVVSGPPMLMVRNLLYTALTRARRLVVLVGTREVIAQMVGNNHIARRYTMLRARLKES